MANEQAKDKCDGHIDIERLLYPFVRIGNEIKLDMGERSAAKTGFIKVNYCPMCGKKIEK